MREAGYMSEILRLTPVLNNPSLVSASVLTCIQNWHGKTKAEEFRVAEIDPECAGGKDFSERYGVPYREGGNCLIISAKRGGERIFAACLVPVGHRTDLKGVVRQHFGGGQISMAPKDEVLAATNMEYGSITPFGLPPEWPILIDSRFIALPRVIVGGGLRRSKLAIPGAALGELPNAVIIEKLSHPESDSL